MQCSFNVIAYKDKPRLRTALEMLRTTQEIERRLEEVRGSPLPRCYLQWSIFRYKNIESWIGLFFVFFSCHYFDGWILLHVAQVSLPLIILHGEADMVTDPAVSKALYEKAKSQDKKLCLYKGAYHAILEGEPDQTIFQVLDDIISWLDQHSTKEGISLWIRQRCSPGLGEFLWQCCIASGWGSQIQRWGFHFLYDPVKFLVQIIDVSVTYLNDVDVHICNWLMCINWPRIIWENLSCKTPFI